MVSPEVSQQLKQLLAFYERGLFHDEEFRIRFASLVTEENATEMLEVIPAKALPWLKEAVVTAAQSTLDEECLSPEESPFQERTVSAAYFLWVAEILLERSADRLPPSLTVVCLPSFEVEWALRLAGSAEIGFTGILTEPAEKIWCHPNPRSIQVRTTQRDLDADLSEGLCALWEKALLRTRHPRQGRMGLDGVSYHFAYSGSGVGKLAGQTWSPKKATVPGKLVAIGHALRSLVKADEESAAQARRKLDSCIHELNGPGTMET